MQRDLRNLQRFVPRKPGGNSRLARWDRPLFKEIRMRLSGRIVLLEEGKGGGGRGGGGGGVVTLCNGGCYTIVVAKTRTEFNFVQRCAQPKTDMHSKLPSYPVARCNYPATRSIAPRSCKNRTV